MIRDDYQATDPDSYQATEGYMREHLRQHCARCHHGSHAGFDHCISDCDCPENVAYTEEMISAEMTRKGW